MGYTPYTPREYNPRLYFAIGNKSGVEMKHCFWLSTEKSVLADIPKAVEIQKETGKFAHAQEDVNGYLKSIEVNKYVNGTKKINSWRITFAENESEYIVDILIDSAYAFDFFKRIESCDLSKPIFIKPMCIPKKDEATKKPILDKNGNQKYNKIVGVYQGSIAKENLVPHKFGRKEVSKGVYESFGGFPELKRIEDPTTGDVELDNKEQLLFLKSIADRVNEKLKTIAAPPKTQAVAQPKKKQPEPQMYEDLPDDADDLPF